MSQIEAALLPGDLQHLRERSQMPQAIGMEAPVSTLVLKRVLAALSQQPPAPSPVLSAAESTERENAYWNAGFTAGLEKGKQIGASPAPSVEPAATVIVDLRKLGHSRWISRELPIGTKLYAAPTAAVHEPEARDQGHPAQAIGGGKES